MDDGYINSEVFELPSFVVYILTTRTPVMLLASLSPEMIWDHISTGKSLPKDIR